MKKKNRNEGDTEKNACANYEISLVRMKLALD